MSTPFDKPKGLIDRLMAPSLRAAYEEGRAAGSPEREDTDGVYFIDAKPPLAALIVTGHITPEEAVAIERHDYFKGCPAYTTPAGLAQDIQFTLGLVRAPYGTGG